MEWHIYIDQQLMADPDLGRIDLTDAVILSAVNQYQSESYNENLKHKDGHVWINHTWFLTQFPLLRLGGKDGKSTVQIAKRFRKLINLGLLEVKYSHTQTLNRVRKDAYYRTSEAFQRLAAYYKAYRDIASDQELSSLERSSRLQQHEKNKPPCPILKDSTGKSTERGENGRYRTVFKDSTPRSLRIGRNGPKGPCIPYSIYSFTKDSPTTPPPTPGISQAAGAPEPLTGSGSPPLYENQNPEGEEQAINYQATTNDGLPLFCASCRTFLGNHLNTAIGPTWDKCPSCGTVISELTAKKCELIGELRNLRTSLDALSGSDNKVLVAGAA